MANGTHQIEYLITEATERVAIQGTAASPTDIMLAGFGFIAYEVRRPKPRLEGKKMVLGSLGLGGGAGVAILEAFRALFG